ncbi:MAG: DUF4783 domain-containing protein [Chlorobi bacterium]|nr:DUF4783 domain-containing protein [Chlorobiota bacterium]
MLHFIKTISFILLMASGTVFTASAQGSISKDIIDATRDGDASALSEYFNENIELVIPQKSGIFSKSQAEMVLKEFFTNNPPENFRIIHEGSRQNASFAIGNYLTNSGTYRFYFLTKNENGKLLIHQLRIEKQND